MSTAGTRLDDLIRIMATLRGPEGCPWDRVQTLASLRPFLLEETYEALEALDAGDHAGLREELGDLLFEIVFLSRIAEEQGHFTIADAIDAVAAKLVRRHPHVFGDADKLSQPEEVLGRWEELKAAERAASGETKTKTLLSGVPLTLPALLRAYEYSTRAATVGFDWIKASDVLDKMEEELREIRQVVERASHNHEGAKARRHEDLLEEEIGDLLFAIANLSRKLGVEPEAALRRANDKFRERFTAVEHRIEARGEKLQEKTLEELEVEWQEVKRRE
jgi:MazG family protein